MVVESSSELSGILKKRREEERREVKRREEKRKQKIEKQKNLGTLYQI